MHRIDKFFHRVKPPPGAKMDTHKGALPTTCWPGQRLRATKQCLLGAQLYMRDDVALNRAWYMSVLAVRAVNASHMKCWLALRSTCRGSGSDFDCAEILLH